MATGSVVLDTSQYVRVNQGLNPLILQAHRDSVRVTFNDVRPAKDNVAFHQLSGADPIYSVPSLDTNVWVLAMTDSSSLVVTEFTGSEDANPIDTIVELSMVVLQQSSRVARSQEAIVRELHLLNARIEEGLDTGITEFDT